MRRRIVDAATSLFHEAGSIDPPMTRIAERAGCSTRSVIRHFGSKEGLIEATIAGSLATIERHRVEPGDIFAAIRDLIDRYETVGDDHLRWIAGGERHPLAHEISERCDRTHQSWVDATFATDLDVLPPTERQARKATLATVTDVRVWRLLRRRGNLSRAATERAILALVGTALAESGSSE